MTEFVAQESVDFLTFFQRVNEAHQRLPRQPWWRGHADATWKLVPGVHRLDGALAHGKGYEAFIATKFSQRAPTRHTNCPASGELAKWLLLAQHYRLKTRLLDWSESPLVALYFAVQDDEHRDKDGALWALDPFTMNEATISQPKLVQPGELNARRLIEAAFTESPAPEDTALGLVTDEVDMRLTVQQSGMTLHGSDKPLEQRLDAKDILTRIPIKAAAKPLLRDALARLGVRPRTLFPDLDHLAADLNADRY